MIKMVKIIEAMGKIWNYHLTISPIYGDKLGGDSDSGRVSGGATGGFDSDKDSDYYAASHYPMVAPKVPALADAAAVISDLTPRINGISAIEQEFYELCDGEKPLRSIIGHFLR